MIESRLTFLDESACDFEQLDAALDKLATCSLPIKQRTLVAATHVVQADGQVGLWITWTTEDRKHGGGNVYGQRLLKGGILSGRPFRINTTHVGVGRLADLQVSRDGSFRVVWEGLGPNGRGKGLRERRYDGKGHPLEDETPVSSPN